MISAFKKTPSVPGGTYKNPRMSYIQQRLQSNLRKVKSFYRFNDVAVRSDHILVTLINSLLIPPTTQRERAYDLVTNTAFSVGNGLGIGSSLYPAKVQMRNWFYGKNVYEILYLTPKPTLEVNYPAMWQLAQPVKVITHPKSDLTFRLLDGLETSDESGYAVIEIDPGLLHWQYRQFAYDQSIKPQGERLGVNHFVAKYVLPNMLDSHLNVVWLNRLIRNNNGQPCGQNQRKEPLALPSSETYVDQSITEMVQHLSQTPLTALQILNRIELPFGGTLLDFMVEPNVYADVQNIKAYRIARSLSAIGFALSMRFQSTGNDDPIRNELFKVRKAIDNERVLKTIRNGEFIADRFEMEISPYIGA